MMTEAKQGGSIDTLVGLEMASDQRRTKTPDWVYQFSGILTLKGKAFTEEIAFSITGLIGCVFGIVPIYFKLTKIANVQKMNSSSHQSRAQI